MLCGNGRCESRKLQATQSPGLLKRLWGDLPIFRWVRGFEGRLGSKPVVSVERLSLASQGDTGTVEKVPGKGGSVWVLVLVSIQWVTWSLTSLGLSWLFRNVVAMTSLGFPNVCHQKGGYHHCL